MQLLNSFKGMQLWNAAGLRNAAFEQQDKNHRVLFRNWIQQPCFHCQFVLLFRRCFWTWWRRWWIRTWKGIFIAWSLILWLLLTEVAHSVSSSPSVLSHNLLGHQLLLRLQIPKKSACALQRTWSPPKYFLAPIASLEANFVVSLAMPLWWSRYKETLTNSIEYKQSSYSLSLRWPDAKIVTDTNELHR